MLFKMNKTVPAGDGNSGRLLDCGYINLQTFFLFLGDFSKFVVYFHVFFVWTLIFKVVLKDGEGCAFCCFGVGGHFLHHCQIHPENWQEDPTDSVERSVTTS